MTARFHEGDGIAGVAVAALTVSNVVTNRWLPPSGYVPWNLTMAAALVGLARAAGHKAADLGFDPRQLRGAARAGAAGSALVGASYGAAIAFRRGNGLLHNERLSSLSKRDAAFHLLVRIPLGTALAEEIAFRSVLPALLGERRAGWKTSLLTSALFGLWHILPSHSDAQANGSTGWRASVGPIGLGVAATTAAGGLLHAVRKRTDHILAPVALHLAANGFGLLAVRLASVRR